jgi:hypothetical protein
MSVVFHECNVHFNKEIYERPKSYMLKELVFSENLNNICSFTAILNSCQDMHFVNALN